MYAVRQTQGVLSAWTVLHCVSAKVVLACEVLRLVLVEHNSNGSVLELRVPIAARITFLHLDMLMLNDPCGHLSMGATKP